MRLVPPTGSIVCSCSTRSTLACVFRLMSPISSRKIVPPSATSNLPRRSATAPVNAPRTWPKSSLSISSSGIAAQLTSTNGAVPAAAERVDGARDELLAGAVLAVDEHAAVGRRRHRDLLAQLAHRVALADHRAGVGRRARAARGSRLPAAAGEARCATTSTVLSSDSGFSTKSNAPSLIARTADSMLPWPEMSTTCASTWRSRSRASVARPSMPGSQTSSTIRSTAPRVTRSRQASPLGDGFDGVALVPQHAASELRTPGSSSTMRMVGFVSTAARS